jgi:hypothetical protein
VLLLHDLQGNVVGEAALSETETKLLKTYNSTEFGVPNSKEAPPTYAWLGAAGVADKLPSGVITQDGITYVPQTGRPLQTEGVALPAPGNAAAAFTRPIEARVGSQAGEDAARELSKAEQERQGTRSRKHTPGRTAVRESRLVVRRRIRAVRRGRRRRGRRRRRMLGHERLRSVNKHSPSPRGSRMA